LSKIGFSPQSRQDRREKVVFDLVVRGHQIKRPHLSDMFKVGGMELLENRPLTDSPEISSPLSVLCVSAVVIPPFLPGSETALVRD
jgi:hypothetical protein